MLDSVTRKPKEIEGQNIGQTGQGAGQPAVEEEIHQEVKYTFAPGAVLDPAISTLLEGDDLLLQMAVVATKAKYTRTNKIKPGTLKITATHAPGCQPGLHPDNVIYDVSVPKVVAKFQTAPSVHEVIAEPPPDLLSLDDALVGADMGLTHGRTAGQKIVGALVLGAANSVQGDGVWARMWPFGDKGLRTYKVVVPSCGMPPDPAHTAPAEVTARVEVFRQTTAKLEIKMPAGRSRKSSKELMRNLSTGEKVLKRVEERGSAGRSGTGSIKVEGEVSSGTDGSGPSASIKGEATFDAGATAALWQSSVTLVYNGTKIDSHVLGNLLDLPKKAIALVTGIRETVPQWGFTWDLDMSFAAGYVEVETQIAPSIKPLHDRVWLVERYATVKIGGELLSITAAFGVGLDVKVEAVKLSVATLILKVEIGMSVSAKLEAEFDSRSGAPAKINSECVGEVFGQAVAEATVLGYGIKSEVKLSTGLKLEVVAEFSKEENKLEGELQYLGVVLDVQATFLWMTIYDGTHPLGESKELWKGPILGGSGKSDDAAAVSATAAAGPG